MIDHAKMRALENRYDGPIPQHLLDDARGIDREALRLKGALKYHRREAARMRRVPAELRDARYWADRYYNIRAWREMLFAWRLYRQEPQEDRRDVA